MYFRIGALKDFAIFTEKHLCWSLFLINIQAWRPATLLKRDSNIGVFCEIYEIFQNTFLCRTHAVAASGNISWTVSLLHLRIMNGIISWYVLTPQCLFHFITCVSLFSISFFFSYFFCGFYYFLVSFPILKKQSNGVVPRFLSRVSRDELLQPYLVINLPGMVQFGKNLSYVLPPFAS